MQNEEITVHDSVDCAWRRLVSEVISQGDCVPAVNDPLSVGSRFGRTERGTRELIATRTTVENPRNRLIFSQSRRFRLDYAIAQFIWTLSNSDQLAPIGFYNTTGNCFSDDGVTVRSAIGPRLFSSPEGNQFGCVIRKLRSDPSTRRAMIQIYLPSDLLLPTKDVSCTGSIHFFARQGHLNAIAHMRSQSALMVLPYDLFLLTMLHEFAAISVGMELGSYWHVCNSAHIYDDELSLAMALVSEAPMPRPSMPEMPASSVHEVDRAILAERYIRERLLMGPTAEVHLEPFELSEYWRNLLMALVADWKIKNGASRQAARVENLAVPYRECLRLIHE